METHLYWNPDIDGLRQEELTKLGKQRLKEQLTYVLNLSLFHFLLSAFPYPTNQLTN